MRVALFALLPGLLASASPAFSREPERPVTDNTVTARDVAVTPATDLNLRGDEIPPLLTAAEQRPYTLRDLGDCQRLAAAIGELDAILGEDVDLPQTGDPRVQPGRVAQSVVGSFIPFRGVIREVSGANDRQRNLRAAIIAGVARRSFLKGVGEVRGCRYPARSATQEIYARRMAEISRKIDEGATKRD